MLPLPATYETAEEDVFEAEVIAHDPVAGFGAVSVTVALFP